MPLCPQVTITPITVTTSGMTTASVIAANAPATTEQLGTTNASAAAALAAANAAQAEAATALAAAGTAYTTAINSLQSSAYAIQNPTTKQLTAIDATGLTVYSGASSTSGARVVLNSTGLAGFNSSGTATFSVSASTGAAVFSGDVTGATITGGTLNIAGNAIINSSGYLTATGATITGSITATSGSFTGNIYASGGTIGGFTIASNYIYSGSSLGIYSDGTITGGNSATLFYGYINIGGGSAGSERLIVTGNSSFNGTGIFLDNLTTYTHFFAPYATNVTAAANGYRVSSSGRLTYTTASSQRYKHDIVDLVSISEYDPKKLLNLPVRAFRYNENYVTPTDERAEVLIPGFIAEEVDAIYPIACDYSEIQGPESWNDRILLPAMLALIQEQEKRIQTLEGK
jgi:hypothetical protein